MNTFYGKIDDKGDALVTGAEFLFSTQGLVLSIIEGLPIGGIGVAAPVPFFLCNYITI